MTPHQKAEELLNKFFNHCSYEWWEGQEGHKENMKQCALIAVDEILTNNMYFKDANNDKYWNDVKKEIEAL
jgi:hypothetical protein